VVGRLADPTADTYSAIGACPPGDSLESSLCCPASSLSWPIPGCGARFARHAPALSLPPHAAFFAVQPSPSRGPPSTHCTEVPVQPSCSHPPQPPGRSTTVMLGFIPSCACWWPHKQLLAYIMYSCMVGYIGYVLYEARNSTVPPFAHLRRTYLKYSTAQRLLRACVLTIHP
jgi:hypothetical protein